MLHFAPQQNPFRRVFPFLVSAIWIFGVCAGCGEDTNLLGLTVPDTHKDTFEAHLAAGRAAYDDNDLSKALKHAEKAYGMNPKSERASLLLGFVHLSLAGADPFGLALRIIAAEEEEKKSFGLQESGGGAGDTLSDIKDAIDITEEELLGLGTLDTSDAALPILVPRCVETVRAEVERLQHISLAIRAVCPFVDEDVRIALDPRQQCTPTEISRVQPQKAHFLWAFSHLTEAMLFNAVITYGTVDPKKSNLELKVEKIKSQQVAAEADLAAFLKSIETLEKTISAVLPVGGVCSPEAPTPQLFATLNDLLAVDLAFAKIPNVPKKITRSLKANLEKIKGAEGVSPTQALKGDLTKKISGGLAGKIDALEAETGKPVPEDQKQALCASFDSISGGAAQRPALCTAPSS